jgi:hypothetical protein
MRPLYLLLFCLPVYSAVTPLTCSIYLPDGTAANGTAYITWPRFTTSASKVIPASPVGGLAVPIVNGSCPTSFSLEATDTATPTGVYYTVAYSFRKDITERWQVPTSASPVNISTIATTTPLPSPSATIALTQLAPGGASASQCLVWSGTHWTPSSDCGSGGGGEVPYEATVTGTSISITASTHGKGLYPDMRVFTNGAYVPIQYDINGSGDISVSGLISGTYYVRIVGGTSTGTPYEADFTGVTSIGPVSQTTHGKGLYPTVLLFSDGSAIPVMPSIDGTGAITISGLVSGTYHLKVY